MRTSLFFCLFWVLITQAFGQSSERKFTIRQWANDTAALESRVITPLREQFSTQACEPGLCKPIYIHGLIDKLKEIRVVVVPVSYLMFRELIMALGNSLGSTGRPLVCPEHERWESIERALKTKLEFTGNVLLLLEVAGSL